MFDYLRLFCFRSKPTCPKGPAVAALINMAAVLDITLITDHLEWKWIIEELRRPYPNGNFGSGNLPRIDLNRRDNKNRMAVNHRIEMISQYIEIGQIISIVWFSTRLQHKQMRIDLLREGH